MSHCCHSAKNLLTTISELDDHCESSHHGTQLCETLNIFSRSSYFSLLKIKIRDPASA